jgi:hypothetical protein
LETTCTNKQVAQKPIWVNLPNGAKIGSSHTAILPFPNLPQQALQAHLFPDLSGQALLSVGTFCDAGCTATFTANTVKIEYQGDVVLEGLREPPGLWTTTLTPTQSQDGQANSAITDELKTNAVKFLHAACFSPTTDTWTKAIKQDFFKTWPVLTAPVVSKHLPKSVATAMGHMDQQRKNVRSTKPKPKNTQDDDGINDTNPPVEDTTQLAFANVVELSECEGKSYSDLTGRFPVQSELGNLYVLVLYAYDANAILVEPLKNRSDAEQLRAYKVIIKRANRGSKLQTHWMDNEASKAIKELLVDEFGLDYQLVPPHIHRRNAAERAIRTFKNHFIAGLCSADPLFPLRLWDRLLPQAEITLNLLRASRSNPTVSAYEAINGPFDYNKTPLAPPGIKVVIHEKPSQRKTWDPHGVLGWYLGPAEEHYRCYRCYVTNTHGERITDTL